MMKRAIVLALVGLVALYGNAHAQGPDQYDVGVFFDPAGTVSQASPVAFTPFNVYVVGFGLDGAVKGFEGQVTGLDPTYIILGTFLAGPAPINVGNPTNFIVGTGACVEAGPAFVLVNYQLGYFAGPTLPLDSLICIGPSVPSSFVPAAPGYLQCDNDLVPFGVAQNGLGFYPDACAVINPTFVEAPISTEQSSWGAVKSNF